MLLFQIFFISKMNISVLNNTNRKKRILNVFFFIYIYYCQAWFLNKNASLSVFFLLCVSECLNYIYMINVSFCLAI